jgi:hypothetical protein
MAMSSATYIFQVILSIFLSAVYTDYAYIEREKNHIRIFISETSVESDLYLAMGTFKIMCDTPTLHRPSKIAVITIK